ncbi:hypothetical protein DPPLL_36500 [Desulfofustis limnaeus]|uniref:Uncharacterized protein n=1 Tax=Desulfofustis limnaeus TaxID=2740163 RepID=A0ABN6M946_9BACT|nr:hypothetical protein DPPLL_36500 [Desulfofustis limnaeus]
MNFQPTFAITNRMTEAAVVRRSGGASLLCSSTPDNPWRLFVCGDRRRADVLFDAAAGKPVTDECIARFLNDD